MKSSDHSTVYNTVPLYKLIYLCFAFFFLLSGCQDFLLNLSNKNTWSYSIGCLHRHSIIISRSINCVSFALLSKKKKKRKEGRKGKNYMGEIYANTLFYIDLYEQGQIDYKELKNDYSFRSTHTITQHLYN